MKLLLGDCLDKLKELEDNSVDSVVTDPPYEIGFMGKSWDDSGIANNPELWKEVLRVLKPGGHLLSFSHSRTYHRQAVAVEDAGFEIRDQIMWVYGSGFPKSHNIGKAVDKIEGNERDVVGDNPNHRERNNNLKEMLSLNNPTITKGNSEWEGWGTALKPAHEPIVMGRKPLSEKTVADNVLKWGTGGINIDGCRVEGKPRTSHKDGNKVGNYQSEKKYGQIADGAVCDGAEGRFPANIIFDEEAGKMLPDAGQGGYGEETTSSASRFFYCPKTSKSDRNEGLELIGAKNGVSQFTSKGGLKCKKCNKWKNSGNPCQCDEPDFEQQQWNGTLDKNSHPTVKPTDLMAYLIRLVTPKGGIVLDPFMGSGSTGKAAVREGMEFIGIERENEYFEIAEARIEYEKKKPIIVETPAGKKVEVEKKVEEKVNQFFG
jgi:site-specific DNA-methyltransferase (adenine-specific)